MLMESSFTFVFEVQLMIRLHTSSGLRGFRLTQLYFNSLFTILLKLPATCFGRTTIFMRNNYIGEEYKS
jgi:hypothetical protein